MVPAAEEWADFVAVDALGRVSRVGAVILNAHACHGRSRSEISPVSQYPSFGTRLLGHFKNDHAWVNVPPPALSNLDVSGRNAAVRGPESTRRQPFPPTDFG